MHKTRTLLIAAVMVTGYSVLAPSLSAHEAGTRNHCYVESTDPGVWKDVDCDLGGTNPSEAVQRTAEIEGAYDAPPIEGPGNPDGEGEWGGFDDPTTCEGGCVFPYIFQAVQFGAICSPSEVQGQPIPQACWAGNGGAVWTACDNPGHWLNGGGVSDGDLPCSWNRGSDDIEVIQESDGTWNVTTSDYVVEEALPFDHMEFKFSCLTCLVDRDLPYVVTSDSLDDDSFHGEGQDEKPGNNGDCRGSVVGDSFDRANDETPVELDTSLVSLFFCNDSAPGPRELSENRCGRTGDQGFDTQNPVTRPTQNDEWGDSADHATSSVYQQKLSGANYTTHHLGEDPEKYDLNGDKPDEERVHPGVDSVAVFLYGPIHWSASCGSQTGVPTSFGTFTVRVS